METSKYTSEFLATHMDDVNHFMDEFYHNPNTSQSDKDKIDEIFDKCGADQVAELYPDALIELHQFINTFDYRPETPFIYVKK